MDATSFRWPNAANRPRRDKTYFAGKGPMRCGVLAFFLPHATHQIDPFDATKWSARRDQRADFPAQKTAQRQYGVQKDLQMGKSMVQ